MKAIDCDAIGKLIEEMLANEAAFPIADRDDGYEKDNIKAIDFVAGDYSRLRIQTEQDREFTITVVQSYAGP